MKLLSLLLLTISIQVQAADKFVARYVSHAGFSPNPQTVTLDIHPSGLVTYEVRTLRSDRVVSHKVAVLAPSQMKKLKAAALKIKAEDLKDLDEGKPVCMDAPSRATLVLNEKGEPVTIAKWQSCHRHEMPDSQEAALIVNLVGALTTLAQWNE